jgi:protein-tyrosine phosphatase
LNYLGLGARGFSMSRAGQMAWPARWLLAPYHASARLNAWAWTCRLPASAQVVPGVRLGRLPTVTEWEAAGRPHVVSLCAEMQVPQAAQARCVPVLDLVTPTTTELRRAVTAIEQMRAQGHEVWVCCALGFSRSAAAMLGWMMHHGQHSKLASAEAALRLSRPSIVLRDEVRARLEALIKGVPHG